MELWYSVLEVVQHGGFRDLFSDFICLVQVCVYCVLVLSTYEHLMVMLYTPVLLPSH